MTELDETLRALDGKFGNDSVVFCRAVERRRDDLTLDAAFHVSDFFRALVDENDHEVNLRVVLCDRVSNLLQDDRLACLGRSND